MKKILLTGLFFALLLGSSVIKGYCYDDYYANPREIKKAIEAYKEGNFLACISTLKEYTDKDSANPVAWYYLGSAYMNIALVNEANAAFDKVIALNTVPKLTSYAIQAELCMKDAAGCKYANFNSSEIKRLQENPAKFISDYYASLTKKSVKSPEAVQIENLIKGAYPNNIHPQAQDFILNEHTKIKASQINSEK